MHLGPSLDDVRHAVDARISRPTWAQLAERLGRLTTGRRAPAVSEALRLAAVEADELGQRGFEDLQAELVRDLDALFVAEELSAGHVFGTGRYERALERARAEPAPGSRRRPLATFDARAREAGVALHEAAATAVGAWHAVPILAAVAVGVAVALVSAPLLGGVAALHDLFTGTLQLAVRLVAATPVIPLVWAALSGLLHSSRRHRIHRARMALTAALHDWSSAYVEARAETVTRSVRAWLEREIERRIRDRCAQRHSYARSHLRAPRPATRSPRRPLVGGEWSTLARLVAPAEPAELLAAFAQHAATRPALASALVVATAGEVRECYGSWLRERVEREIAAPGALARALSVLPDADQRQRVRALASGCAPAFGGQELDHIAALPRDPGAAEPLRALLRGTLDVGDFVEAFDSDRIDVVTISRHRFGLADVVAEGDHPASLVEEVRRALSTAGVEGLVRRHGLLDTVFPPPSAA